MARLFLASVVFVQLKCLWALCSYSSYSSGDYILVADDNCKNTTVCAVDNTCKPLYFTNNQDAYYFTNVYAIGSMRNYKNINLTVHDSQDLTMKDMQLPESVNLLILKNVTKLDLTSAKASSWSSVEELRLVSCPNLVVNNKINWPPNLFTIVLKDNVMINIPQSLPSTLKELAIQYNGLTDLNYLPENLSLLNFFNNSLSSVTNKDWRSATLLRLGENPLEIFAGVQLSNKLKLFDCKSCKLKNITVDTGTYNALNALKPWNGSDDSYDGFIMDNNIKISTDPNTCKAIGGEIKPIFQGQPTLTATACVLPTTSTATTAPTHINTSSSSSNTGVIAGVVIGVVVVIGIAIAVFICIRRKNKQKQEQPPYYSVNENTNVPHQPKDAYDRNMPTQPYGTGTGPSQGTGASQGTGGRIADHIDNSVDLDVSLLRHHRLELSDLVPLGNKPLAAGAYGEVWRGTYGGQQVAIKRTKNREPHQVHKFIDEIILMSQYDSPKSLDSDYIVKFIGASWTKPIEIECVVEYMDLGDLRSYLVNQSPAQFPWDQKYQSIVSIVRGLVYLHTYKPPIIHRDLKSRNVLMDTNKGTKLTDFGTSRVAEEDDLMTNGIGTYQWMAPEVIAGTSYSAPADIYSFGIILSEFCTHEVPYAGMRHPQTGKLLAQHYLLNEVREGRLHPSFDGENVPSWVKEVAMQCLQLNEHDRPTALELSSILNRIKP
ncbi:kinase [Thraustotheca clavata]|uniref:Kinase n=1 Tax=Thraustotheca clavata TaxID=74557 RepID=A0A1V9ZYI6_9STRA|nr:kinase [Thraustotheca clavata]